MYQKKLSKNLIIYWPTVSALCTFLIHTAVLQKYDHYWTVDTSKIILKSGLSWNIKQRFMVSNISSYDLSITQPDHVSYCTNQLVCQQGRVNCEVSSKSIFFIFFGSQWKSLFRKSSLTSNQKKYIQNEIATLSYEFICTCRMDREIISWISNFASSTPQWSQLLMPRDVFIAAQRLP